jgi:hypothetical protein
LAAVCEEIEKEEKKDNVDERHICIKVQPGWISCAVSKTTRRPRKTQAVFPQEYTDCISHQVKLSTVFTPSMWLRLSSGMAITTERVRTSLGPPWVTQMSCPRPDRDLTFQCKCFLSSPWDFYWKDNFYTCLKWPDRDLTHSVNQPQLLRHLTAMMLSWNNLDDGSFVGPVFPGNHYESEYINVTYWSNMTLDLLTTQA